MFHKRRNALGSVVANQWITRTLTSHDLSVDRTGSLASLAKKYGVPWETIVQRNGVKVSTSAINAWVMDKGGKMLSSGWPVFVPGNKILLPKTAVIPDPSDGNLIKSPVADTISADMGGGLWWLIGLGAATVGLLAFKKKKKTKTKTTSATITRF